VLGLAKATCAFESERVSEGKEWSGFHDGGLASGEQDSQGSRESIRRDPKANSERASEKSARIIVAMMSQ